MWPRGGNDEIQMTKTEGMSKSEYQIGRDSSAASQNDDYKDKNG